MSGLVTLESAPAPDTVRYRLLARAAVAAARIPAGLPPRRLRRFLERCRSGARPADAERTRRARDAVVSVSVPCAGPRCLQRSIATALLCRAEGVWPEWYAGVATHPFRAHAWVGADGEAVGEDPRFIRGFRVLMTVPAPAVD